MSMVEHVKVVYNELHLQKKLSEEYLLALRLALVGCGIIAETHHAPQLHTLPAFELVAAIDVDARRRAAVASKFGIAQHYDDLETALKRTDIDAVAILTPPATHVALALTAINAGKHVFIEKPPALTLEDCERLIAARDAMRVRAMVGFHLRWHHHTRMLRDLIKDREKSAFIQSTFTSVTPPQISDWRHDFGGDLLTDSAIHHIDLWQFLSQSEITHISADRTGDDHVVVNARTANDILLSGSFSRAAIPESTIRVFTKTHKFSADFYRFDGLRTVEINEAYGGISALAKSAVQTALELPRGLRVSRHGGDFAQAYQAQWQHFADCIAQDRAPSASLEDGRESLRVVLAAHHAMQNHYRVTVDAIGEQSTL